MINTIFQKTCSYIQRQQVNCTPFLDHQTSTMSLFAINWQLFHTRHLVSKGHQCWACCDLDLWGINTNHKKLSTSYYGLTSSIKTTHFLLRSSSQVLMVQLCFWGTIKTWVNVKVFYLLLYSIALKSISHSPIKTCRTWGRCCLP